MVADSPGCPPPPCPSWFRSRKPAAEKLYQVKRITDGSLAEIRCIADGQLQLYWTMHVRFAARLPRAKAQALAVLMAIGAAPFAETIIIEEAQ